MQTATIIQFPAPAYAMRVPQPLDPEVQEIVSEVNALAGFLKCEVRAILEAVEAIDKRMTTLREMEGQTA